EEPRALGGVRVRRVGGRPRPGVQRRLGGNAEVWSAVRRTGGQVLEYDGAIIEAYFHSTCGGSTAAVEEAFKTAQERPYLRPVSDASGRGRAYCDLSPRFRWREEWDGTTLRAILSRTLPA